VNNAKPVRFDPAAMLITPRRAAALLAACIVTAFHAGAPGAVSAQVRRIEITAREAVAGGQAFGEAGAYETITGRIHGEVDPKDPRNRVIQDLDLAPRNAGGRVEYVATFSLMKPVAPARASGVLVYSVVNRGTGAPAAGPDGHISLVSGWQGDVTPTADNQTIRVPVAKGPGGAAITGPVLARFIDLSPGTTTASIRIGSMGTAFYPPATLDTSRATLTFHTSETPRGEIGGAGTVPAADWAFGDCRTSPFPGTPDPTRICVSGGFDPARVYELVYTAKDPLVLGIGLAATRDIVSFFRRAASDAEGHPNPVAGIVHHAIGTGQSQSGNFLKTFVHLGFNADLANRVVFDGIMPLIAARQTPMNFRFAAPGGAAALHEPGSEPVVWWNRYADTARGRRAASLLDRCTATRTCPKVVEVLGSAEFWGLRMSPGLVGTDASADIPLPPNVRRYYSPGTTHGGGQGGFALEQRVAARCVLQANPNPMSETFRALTQALVDWVVKGTEPPPSRYPTIADGTLVAATRAATGFPAIPGVGFGDVNVVLDYDFGTSLDYADLTGVISRQPPAVKRVLPTLVPAVDADGNERAGVASVLHRAPLGTYLGWNVQASGFFKGGLCGFQGGYVPFARTRAEREAGGDPRPSLEERYGTREGYACVVRRAANDLVRDRYLLPADAARLVAEAAKSALLPASADAPPEARRAGERLCR
jgi:hypothetical protein